MNQRPAFSLIELLIALGLSLFIMITVMQSYRSVTKTLTIIRQQVRLHDRTAIVIQQFEKDCSTMFIPTLHQIIPDAKEDEKKPDEKLEEKPKEEPIKKTEEEQKKEAEETLKQALVIISDDQDPEKVRDPKWYLFKSISGTSTNAFKLADERAVNLVRIKYELIVDKERSQRNKKSYSLVRKQSFNTQDYKLKAKTGSASSDDTANEISSYTIADSIKSMSVKIIAEKKEGEKDPSKQGNKEREFVELFSWGGEAPYGGHLPIMLSVRLVFWDENMNKELATEFAFPFSSYPTEIEPESTEKAPIKTDEKPPETESDGTGTDNVKPSADRSGRRDNNHGKK